MDAHRHLHPYRLLHCTMWRLVGHEVLRTCLDYFVSGIMIEALGNADQPGPGVRPWNRRLLHNCICDGRFQINSAPVLSHTEVGTYRRPAQMEFEIDVLTVRLTMVQVWRPEIAATSLLEPQSKDSSKSR
ncbi:hypothetical protein ASPBRDRAFT_581399 [Aspergillus brasiliensis CBS 101740]|uniref:Uncharacterized protein n=1 Tax=Aspergillus brasiliensis (strain CBS 101740 / IMI 381727 / IBT 21946) TaxID=767769 RepID=A0A1L9UJR5_ASPBC|nr:hypothetical protein ASPBRDRAFT_581399 [Aspergillus brasiliensis CBS 101740]